MHLSPEFDGKPMSAAHKTIEELDGSERGRNRAMGGGGGVQVDSGTHHETASWGH